MTLLRSTVRYNRREGVWEMRCASCASAGQTTAWWELSTDLWDPSSGLLKCRACLNLAKRLRRRQSAEERRAKQRAYYRDHRAERLAWRHAYHAANKERINAERRAKYAAAKEQRAHAETLWELAADG